MGVSIEISTRQSECYAGDVVGGTVTVNVTAVSVACVLFLFSMAALLLLLREKRKKPTLAREDVYVV